MSCFIVREQEAKKLEKSVLFGKVSQKAYISQAIASPISKNMTAGYLKLDPGYSKYLESPVDEIDLFLEGSLTYAFEGKSFTAQKGDIVFIERGSRVNFITEGGCFVFYATYPLMQETVDALVKKSKKK